MLVNMKEMLNKAKEEKYAVGQFNINNLEWTIAILKKAQELNSPVILGVSQGAALAYVQSFYRLLTSLWPNSGCRKRKPMEF